MLPHRVVMIIRRRENLFVIITLILFIYITLLGLTYTMVYVSTKVYHRICTWGMWDDR